MAANLTQILNFKANFYQEFELFSEKQIHANNGGHFAPYYDGGARTLKKKIKIQ